MVFEVKFEYFFEYFNFEGKYPFIITVSCHLLKKKGVGKRNRSALLTTKRLASVITLITSNDRQFNGSII